MQDHAALLRGDAAPTAGTEVHRARVWPSLAVLVAILAAGILAYGYFAEGHSMRLTGKQALGVVAMPFIALWWVWNVARAVRTRAAGHFGWVLSDAEFTFVGPTGVALGPLPLAAFKGLYLVNIQGASPVPELVFGGTSNGAPVEMTVRLHPLSEAELGLHAMQPSRGKALFRALASRLARVNPGATVMDLTKS